MTTEDANLPSRSTSPTTGVADGGINPAHEESQAPTDREGQQETGNAPTPHPRRRGKTVPQSPFSFRDPLLPLGTRAVILTLAILAAFLPLLVPAAYVGAMDIVPARPALLPVFLLGAGFALIAALAFDILALVVAAGHEDELLRLRRLLSATAGLFLILVLGLIHPLLAIPPVAITLLVLMSRPLVHRIASPRLPSDTHGEITAILAGRSGCKAKMPIGQRLALVTSALIPTAGFLAALATLAAASYIAAGPLLTQGGVVASSLAGGMAAALVAPLALPLPARARVLPIICPPEDDESDKPAPPESVLFREMAAQGQEEDDLTIKDLKALDASDHALLSVPAARLPTGKMIGIEGPVASGKSLFLRCIADPWCLGGLVVSGNVAHQGENLWRRSHDPRSLPCLHIGSSPVFLPVSIAENIVGTGLPNPDECARRALERVGVFDEEGARILSREAPSRLTEGECRLVAFARAFHFQPSLYLIDRPELFLDGRKLAIIMARLAAETRAGRTVILASNERKILEKCDYLVRIEHGRIAQAGPASRLLADSRSGWQMLHLDLAEPDAEDRLHLWLRGMFTRKGDEPNRRRVSLAASQLVAALLDKEPPDTPHAARFQFRHSQGFCHLRAMDDRDPLPANAIAGLRDCLAPFLVRPAERADESRAANATQFDTTASGVKGSSHGEVGATSEEHSAKDPYGPPSVFGVEQTLDEETGLRRIDLLLCTFDPRKKGTTDKSHQRREDE